MKKTLAIVLFVAECVTAMAQSGYRGIVLNANVGMSSYDANSAISMFCSTERISTVSGTAITIGYRNDCRMYGARVGFNILTVAHGSLEEVINPYEFLLLMRRYLPLSDKFELYTGISVGFAMVFNAFEYQGVQYSYTRYGVSEDFEVGIDYRLSGASSIGLHAAVSPLRSLFNDSAKLPDGLTGNRNNAYGGCSVSIQYSLGF